jgi:hypothetical protein
LTNNEAPGAEYRTGRPVGGGGGRGVYVDSELV